jgi:hypothetical protein
MHIDITCSCGQRYRVKESLAGKRVKCQKCAAAIAVPATTLSTDNGYATSSDSSLSSFDEQLTHSVNLPGLGRKCPNCTVPLAPHATFCVACGFNLKTGQATKTTRDASVGSHYPSITPVRTALSLVGGMALLVGLVTLIAAANGEGMRAAIVPGIVITVFGAAGCAAAILAISEIRIEKTPKGRAQVIKSRGLGPFRNVCRYDTHEFDAAWFIQTATKGGTHGILLAFMLLFLCFGLVPGLIWWAMLLRGNEARVSYRVELRKEGCSPVTLFRGGEDSKHDANAIARLIKNATELPLEQDLGLLGGDSLTF